jgi:alpha-tubulin suppressor-like RCC1 family protein
MSVLNVLTFFITAVLPTVSVSLALTEAGEVFSWGDNSYGQLGRGQLDESQTKQPKYALVF